MDHINSTHLTNPHNKDNNKESDKKYLLSPSLVRRVENFPIPTPQNVFYNSLAQKNLYDREQNPQYSKIKKNSPPYNHINKLNMDRSFNETRTNQNLNNDLIMKISSASSAKPNDYPWDPKWKILSKEHPSHFKREYITNLLSMRPHDIPINESALSMQNNYNNNNNSMSHNISINESTTSIQNNHYNNFKPYDILINKSTHPIQNNYLNKFNDDQITNFGALNYHNPAQTYSNSIKFDPGSYTKKFGYGNSYIKSRNSNSDFLNSQASYQNSFLSENADGNCAIENFENIISKSTSHTSRPTFKEVFSNINNSLIDTSRSYKQEEPQIQQLNTPFFQLQKERASDNMRPISPININCSGNLNQQVTDFYHNNNISQKIPSYNKYSDKLALIKKQINTSDRHQTPKLDLISIDKKLNLKSQEQDISRRSKSVAPIRTGWKYKFSTSDNFIPPNNQEFNLSNDQDIASLHNQTIRDKNFQFSNNRKDKNEEILNPTLDFNSSESDDSYINDTESFQEKPKNVKQDQVFQNIDSKQARSKFFLKPSNIPTSLSNKKNIGDLKSAYTTTENLQEFTTPLNSKWITNFSLRLKISTTNWSANVEALLDARRLAKFHPEIIFNSIPNTSSLNTSLSLRNVVLDIIKLLNSPRSTLAKHASLCLVDLYYFGGKKMDVVNDEIVPSCLKKSSQNSTDFLSDATYCVLVQMCRSVTPSKAFTSVINATHSNRHQGFRTVAVKCLAVLIDRLKHNLIKTKELPTLIHFLLTTSHEASPDTRNVSRIAISGLMRNIGDKIDQLYDLGFLSSSDISELQDCSSKAILTEEQLILDPFHQKSIF